MHILSILEFIEFLTAKKSLLNGCYTIVCNVTHRVGTKQISSLGILFFCGLMMINGNNNNNTLVFYFLLAEQPGVLQVVPSRTVQLHSGSGIGQLNFPGIEKLH